MSPPPPKVPSFAKTKVWPSTECNQVIFVWYDAEGRDPAYELVHFEEIKKKQWTYRLAWVDHRVTVHSGY